MCAGNCSYVFWEGVTVFITQAFVNTFAYTYTIEWPVYALLCNSASKTESIQRDCLNGVLTKPIFCLRGTHTGE